MANQPQPPDTVWGVPDDLLTRPAPAAAGPAPPPETVIRPPRGWEGVNAAELWRFRELVYFLAWRDVKVRYKQTALGAAWAVLQPAMMMVVFTIFFNRMAGASPGDLPYPLFVYAGLLPWTFFATSVSSAGNSVVGSERLITKVYFPRLAVPFACVLAAVVDWAIAFCLLLGMMLWYGLTPGVGVLGAVGVFATIVLAAAGVGTLLAALNVAYRDFRHATPFLVQMWMFATPSIYMQAPSEGHGPLHALLALNPMDGLIGAFRAAVLGGDIDWLRLGVSAAAALALFLAGCLYFRKVEDSFADVI
jgi:lipopolysaccharide transport system permease protein